MIGLSYCSGITFSFFLQKKHQQTKLDEFISFIIEDELVESGPRSDFYLKECCDKLAALVISGNGFENPSLVFRKYVVTSPFPCRQAQKKKQQQLFDMDKVQTQVETQENKPLWRSNLDIRRYTKDLTLKTRHYSHSNESEAPVRNSPCEMLY
eukprot:Sdes_comp18751_c0_seq1m9130